MHGYFVTEIYVDWFITVQIYMYILDSRSKTVLQQDTYTCVLFFYDYLRHAIDRIQSDSILLVYTVTVLWPKTQLSHNTLYNEYGNQGTFIAFNGLCCVIIGIIPSSGVDRRCEISSDYKTGICCFHTKHAYSRSNICLVRIMLPSGATCIPVNYSSCELAL